MLIRVMGMFEPRKRKPQTATTPFEHLVTLHIRLLELRANASSEVSAAEDAASFGDALKAEQHFHSAKVYEHQVDTLAADIKTQFDALPELERLKTPIEDEAKARYSSAA